MRSTAQMDASKVNNKGGPGQLQKLKSIQRIETTVLASFVRCCPQIDTSHLMHPSRLSSHFSPFFCSTFIILIHHIYRFCRLKEGAWLKKRL